MNNLPNELEEHILDYLFKNKCYLTRDNLNLKICACVSKKFNNHFECKTKKFYIDNKYIEFCSKHDDELLENCKNIFERVIKNYDNNFNYYVIYSENNLQKQLPLSVFNLEPYISIMNDNYIFHYNDIPNNQIVDQIKKIK